MLNVNDIVTRILKHATELNDASTALLQGLLTRDGDDVAESVVSVARQVYSLAEDLDALADTVVEWRGAAAAGLDDDDELGDTAQARELRELGGFHLEVAA